VEWKNSASEGSGCVRFPCITCKLKVQKSGAGGDAENARHENADMKM